MADPLTALRELPSSLNERRRARDLDALAGGEVVDVLVVGGGATGTGVALDAATRGLSVALVERRDLANGTSRWSSKLVHGGLRYLGTGQLGLAYESSVERGILMERTAPHLTHRLPFIAPIGAGYSTADATVMRVAFAAADGLRIAAGTSSATLPRSSWLSRNQVLRAVPGLDDRRLKGGALQWDGQLTDDARLVVAIARTAAAFGARIVTYAAAQEVTGDGAVVRDERSGEVVTIRARTVVNATGVWASTLHPEVQLRPSRGAHLLLPAALLGAPRAAITIPVPGQRNRYVFALPQPAADVVVVGVTDDAIDGEPTDDPVASSDDLDLLLAVVGSVLRSPPTRAEVIGSYAGLRPLLATGSGATADLSREHRILRRRDGLLTIVGGKLTTYRRMAQDTLDRLVSDGSLDAPRSRTALQPLVGAAPRHRLQRLGARRHDLLRYGTEATSLDLLAAAHPELAARLTDGSPHRLAELVWGLQHEGALTADDLLDRRLRVGLVPGDRERAAPVADDLVSAWTSGSWRSDVAAVTGRDRPPAAGATPR